MPVAEKTPRQKKRKASQEVAPLPDDEKRWKPKTKEITTLSKNNSRAQVEQASARASNNLRKPGP